MKVLKVRSNHGELDVSFKLERFIADWPVAQAKFIAGMTKRFQGWQPILPQDVVTTSGMSLGEMRCLLRLFQGACSVVLEAEGVKLSFAQAARDHRPVIGDIIRNCATWLRSDLDDHGLNWAFFNAREHVQAVNESAIDETEDYLQQFTVKGVESIVQPKSGVRYAPSARIVLSDESDGWALRRTVEKSEWFADGGLFIETSVHFPSPNLGNFEALMNTLVDIDDLADEALGLQYVLQS